MINISKKQLITNIKNAISLDIAWLDQIPHRFSGDVAIIGGAPSIKSKIEEIRNLQNNGCMIWSVNGTHDFLADNGISPDFFAMLEGRSCNKFVDKPVNSCVYLLASQCHPMVFRRIPKNQTVLWHCESGEIDNEIINKKARIKGIDVVTYVSGKGSIGMTSIGLAYTLGFNKFHIFGCDSSFSDSQHAYNQPQNDKDKIIEADYKGALYKTTPLLYGQVHAYVSIKEMLEKEGCEFIMHSEGLIKAVHDNN